MPKRVLLNGFLVDVEVPSEERLTTHVNVTLFTEATHLIWVGEMQDLMADFDQAYREQYGKRQFGRGRSVRVRYVKAPDGSQIKVAECQPYPSMLINRLKETRKQVYATLNSYCLILQEEKIGKMIRKVYFLPATLAPQLMNEIEDQNKVIDTIQRSLVEFENTVHFAKVMTHIKKAVPSMELHARLPHIRVAPVPLSLSKSFFESYLEDEGKKAVVELDENRKRGIDLLRVELEQRREQMINAINKNLQQRLVTYVQDVEEAVKQFIANGRSRKKVSKRFTRLIELVENVGADKAPFEAVKGVYEALETTDKAALARAIDNLATSFGLQASTDQMATIKTVSNKVRGKSMLLMTIE